MFEKYYKTLLPNIALIGFSKENHETMMLKQHFTNYMPENQRDKMNPILDLDRYLYCVSQDVDVKDLF
jgi:hypothetical protein